VRSERQPLQAIRFDVGDWRCHAICAGDLEKIRLTNDSSRAALESADKRPIRKNKTRNNRRSLALAAFYTGCIRKNTDTHPSA
jgi:hypothetical protein